MSVRMNDICVIVYKQDRCLGKISQLKIPFGLSLESIFNASHLLANIFHNDHTNRMWAPDWHPYRAKSQHNILKPNDNRTYNYFLVICLP